MAQPLTNPLEELSDAVAGATAASPAPLGAAPILAAQLFSLALHAILVLNASVFTFHGRFTEPSRLQFACGDSADAMSVTLSLVSPSIPPSSVTPGNTKVQVPPKEPVTADAKSEQAPPKASPQLPQPFEKTPTPSASTVEGNAPGHSPAADRMLEGDSAEADEPQFTSDPLPVERTVSTSPHVEAFRSQPVASPRPERIESASAFTGIEISTASQPDHLAGAVALAPLPPHVEFQPSLSEPQPSMVRAGQATPDTKAPSSETPSQPATSGVTQGVEVELVIRYPQMSRLNSEEGMVVLEIEVLADGRAGRVRILETPGHRLLEQAALDAVRKAQFKPALRNGQPVREIIIRKILFRL